MNDRVFHFPRLSESVVLIVSYCYLRLGGRGTEAVWSQL